MPSFEPTAALVAGEQALRQFLEVRLREQLGPDWLAQVARPATAARPSDMDTWTKLRGLEEATRGRRGLAQVPPVGLEYAQFRDLLDIAWRYWDRLGGVLGKRPEAECFLNRFADLRNTVAHSRELLPAEADLLSGIAGELRNRVTKYMSTTTIDGDYYPRIESVSDHLGNSPLELSRLSPAATVHTGVSLAVGDLVTFRCRGNDPQGRLLTWWLRAGVMHHMPFVDGEDVTLSWTVSEHDVGDVVSLNVFMAAKGASFHRHNREFDGHVLFVYRVRPPRDQVHPGSDRGSAGA